MNRYVRNIIMSVPVGILTLFVISFFGRMTWWSILIITVAVLFAIGTNAVAIWHSKKHGYDIGDNTHEELLKKYNNDNL